MNEEKIKNEWEQLDNADIEEVCRLLRSHETRIQDYLADCVSSICDVDKLDMMTNTRELAIVHTRWFFWYSYRYMTNESYGRISQITFRYGKNFTEQSISNSVNKMGNMIAKQTFWAKRWDIIKRIIKLRDQSDNKDDNPQTISIVVHHPKDVEVKLEKKQ